MTAATIKPTRAPALYPLVAMIAGLLLARHLPLPPLLLTIAACGLALGALRLARVSTVSWGLCFCLSATLGGWAYGTFRLPATPPDPILNLPLRETTLTVKMDRVFTPSDAYNTAAGLARVQTAPPTSKLHPGTPLYVRLNLPEDGSFELVRGQILQITGLLAPLPPDTPADSFAAYLKETGVHYTLERSSELSIVREASAFRLLCHRLNDQFEHLLNLGAPGEGRLQGIYTAMLLGKKTALDADQKDRFRTTGTMHLFAISGLHIGVVGAVIAQALLLVRTPRALAPFIGLPLLYTYVEVTGAAPSAVRAFLMVAFFWCSYALVRQRSPFASMVASAIFVLLLQPGQLWLVGFQLSYLVVFSILLFGIPLYEALKGWHRPFRDRPRDEWGPWRQAYLWLADKIGLLLAISLAAWLISAPLSAAHFGFIAPYAIAVNLLLVNLAALAISTGVLSLATGLLGVSAFTWFFNHAAWVVLALMDGIVAANLRLPLAVIECPDFSESLGYLTVFAFMGILLMANASGSRKLCFIAAPITVLIGLAIGWIQQV